jgi:hypothetical protein
MVAYLAARREGRSATTTKGRFGQYDRVFETALTTRRRWGYAPGHPDRYRAAATRATRSAPSEPDTG